MIECYRQRKPLPNLVENTSQDDEFTRRIKRIIAHMTHFKSVERKNIQEVDEEFTGDNYFAFLDVCNVCISFQP